MERNIGKKLLVDISRMWFDPECFPYGKIQIILKLVLIILGDRDEGISVEHAVEMYKMIPNAQLAIFPNTGHSLSRNKYKEFSQSIMNFWKQENPTR